MIRRLVIAFNRWKYRHRTTNIYLVRFEKTHIVYRDSGWQHVRAVNLYEAKYLSERLCPNGMSFGVTLWVGERDEHGHTRILSVNNQDGWVDLPNSCETELNAMLGNL